MKIPLFSLIFLVSLVQILLSTDLGLVSGQCLENQRSLLVRLKNGLTFDPSSSTKLVPWNQSSTDCCNWEGVTCETSTGLVIGLDLNNKSITDGINSSSPLFSLQFLQMLNLAYNNFNSAQIPSGLFNLTSLTYLNLSNSGFAGQIPNGFSRLTRLVILDLSTSFNSRRPSSLKLENPNLTMLVQKLLDLAELYLDGVDISTQGGTWSQTISSSLPNLRVLSLSNTHISGPVDSSLEKLKFLSVIRLNQNKLNSPFPDFFANYLNLTTLRLDSCNLSGTFPEQILKREKLQNLDLSSNRLLHGSLPELPQNGSLRTLVLSFTNFSGLLPDSIGNLGMVSRMELNNCNFSRKIPNSMANLTRLVYLDFSFNKFTGHIPSFQNSTSLTYLDISHNELSGTIPWTHFEGLINLISIDLQFNAFKGSIPSSLFSLPSLQRIKLSNNQFDGLLPNFPNASSSQLDTLDLSSNNLNGSLPVSLFDVKSLTYLSLSSNKLTGQVQLETLKRLGNLTTLDLSYNRFSIETSLTNSSASLLPRFITLKLATCKLQHFPNLESQSRLEHLDLSDNQIGGEIPNWIWNIGNGSLTYLNLSRNLLVNLQKPYAIFPSLGVLDFHSNRLTGEIPIPPTNALYVDYSANYFSSSIPPDIGNNLTCAIFFSVSRNNLTGNIPASICSGIYLQVLDLSNNGFNGTIPPCLLGQSEAFGVLNLGNNSLTGNISDTFGRNCGLQSLDLHANHLEGKVPQSMANCTMLEVLNLGNNQINDTFPCFLKNSSNLRVLVLRFNMFHGYIQCAGPRSHWPNLQIVDIASNSFTGKVPRNLNWTGMMGDKDDAKSKVHYLRFEVLQFSHLYYQDTVKLAYKGLEVELVKILTIFDSVDISNNKFEGDIPETVGKLKALRLLNLSHNALTGSIPPSLGNLKQLESLDLSVNNLTGMIPVELTSLTFLSFLNLSHNRLNGKIPSGSQFQTFTKCSFEGNKRLCGDQLNITCSSGAETGPSSAPNDQAPGSSPFFDWQFIFTGIGFGVGAAIVLGRLMFLKQGIFWWDECIDELVIMILSTFGITFNGYYDLTVEAEDDTEEEPPDNAKHSDDELGAMEDEVHHGRYCVFCSKIDMVMNTVVHNPKCNCHSSTPIYSSSSSFSSSSS